MSLRDALELPDEPRLVTRGPLLALAGAAFALASGVVVARTFAVGGWRSSNFFVGVLLAGPALAVAWTLSGPHRQRTLLSGAAVAVAIALVPVASAGATPSTARLSSMVDTIGLPGRVQRETRIGNGRCRSACSEIRRVAVVERLAFAKVYGQVYFALKSRGFEVKLYEYAVGAPARIDAKYKNILVSLELRSLTSNRIRIATVALADGPTPSHSVG